MEAYLVLIIAIIVIFVVLYMVYGNEKKIKTTKQKSVNFNIQNNEIIHIDQDEPIKKNDRIRVGFSNDYVVKKNQQGTSELERMYEKARDVVPSDNIQCYWEGKRQMQQLPYANPTRCSLLDGLKPQEI